MYKKLLSKCNKPINHLMITAILAIFFLSSCSSLQKMVYLSTIDSLDGDIIKKNESLVRVYMEQVLNEHERYVIKAYMRNVINCQLKRTKLMHHSFYVIFDEICDFHTLSFYGTKIALYSDGAWLMDGDSDIDSYLSYIAGKNKWDVIEIKNNNGINVYETVKNIIMRMDKGFRYYYRDHLNNKPDFDNCNTALHETLVENKMSNIYPDAKH